MLVDYACASTKEQVQNQEQSGRDIPDSGQRQWPFCEILVCLMVRHLGKQRYCSQHQNNDYAEYITVHGKVTVTQGKSKQFHKRIK